VNREPGVVGDAPFLINLPSTEADINPGFGVRGVADRVRGFS
jgi:hypothetical protein